MIRRRFRAFRGLAVFGGVELSLIWFGGFPAWPGSFGAVHPRLGPMLTASGLKIQHANRKRAAAAEAQTARRVGETFAELTARYLECTQSAPRITQCTRIATSRSTCSLKGR